MASALHLLNPGDVAVATRGERLETLLGSCVAVLLNDPRGTVGAMCHIVHACEPPAAAPADTHHARPALMAMARQLQGLGLVARLCRARVYGGANMFPQRYAGGHIGATNVQRVLALLAEAGIAAQAESVGGNGYRKLSWVVGSGEPQCVVVEPAASPAPFCTHTERMPS
jgi:chemotaxis protein CheD